MPPQSLKEIIMNAWQLFRRRQLHRSFGRPLTLWLMCSHKCLLILLTNMDFCLRNYGFEICRFKVDRACFWPVQPIVHTCTKSAKNVAKCFRLKRKL